MITLLGSPRRCCDGLTRRETLTAGALTMADAFELRGNDFRVVEDQRVARFQECNQIADPLVGKDRIGACVDDKQPGAVARVCRPQPNVFLGQIEIEKIDTHDELPE